MIAKLIEFVKDLLVWAKTHVNTIILIAIVMLFVLFSFALGYIIARYQMQTPIKIIKQQV